MLNKLYKKTKSENFSSFLHFLAVFTGIFVIMTVIILNVLRYGLYTTVDTSLEASSQNANDYVTMSMMRSYETQSGTSSDGSTAPSSSSSSSASSSSDKSYRDLFKPTTTANTSYLIYDKDGNILNGNLFDVFSTVSSIKLNKKNLGQVYSIKDVENSYGLVDSYHAITVAVDNEFYEDAAYVTIVVNTTQVESTNDRYIKIIIIVMATFWLISIFASVYLAKWSRKPIVASYEKQKAFVENASHELRTPLAVLQNRLESLFRKPDATILDNSESIAASLDEVRNMRILTTNLLNLARRDDGITPEIVELKASFFDDIFENYEMIAEEADKIFISSNTVSRDFKSDKTLLKQLMTILFDNAVKYTEDDGQIAISVSSTEKNLFIRVSDNGPGISDEDKKKIFDRFYRVDKARTRQKGGFGLGLSLAKQIVDSLKGQITVKDNDPKGTIFEVKL
ncbi:sensor histidine kinase [Streptococcus loxodontisalivarius]|uniref:histidine kinase n=1 Tax=Streptococcus loxodontisalivarius TaxID=1349415 RepID=A0ABS2PP89_9STRE|nr:HAMP domain-containing sensor histidine kinase [Streptococcus loxodontisalivarius]MBM7641851.1 two-component system sensor histidine kinase CiaH [Streptococcus loxodontisalivarius]